MKKYINLANSTFNLYVLHIKLAQNTKQFRRLVLENFITVIHFLFSRKGILWASKLPVWGCLRFVIVVFLDHTHLLCLGPGFLGC